MLARSSMTVLAAALILLLAGHQTAAGHLRAVNHRSLLQEPANTTAPDAGGATPDAAAPDAGGAAPDAGAGAGGNATEPTTKIVKCDLSVTPLAETCSTTSTPDKFRVELAPGK
jgi:hypothetical protein